MGFVRWYIANGGVCLRVHPGHCINVEKHRITYICKKMKQIVKLILLRSESKSDGKSSYDLELESHPVRFAAV